MTELVPAAYGPNRLARLGRFLLNGTVGTLLCAGPVTAVALGWLTRRQGHLARDRFGAAEEPRLDPRPAQGRWTTVWPPLPRLGRLGRQNPRGPHGACRAARHALPFTLPRLGAWWAGWENAILAGQFLDSAWWRWLFHPALTPPWAG